MRSRPRRRPGCSASSRSHPKDRHGAHRYSLGAFGLDARALRPRFKSYCERFGLEPEAAEPGPRPS
jgi:hypothetical protein